MSLFKNLLIGAAVVAGVNYITKKRTPPIPPLNVAHPRGWSLAGAAPIPDIMVGFL